jgi:hypothetical protein
VNRGNGHADALYEGVKLMRWGKLRWYRHHLQLIMPVRRSWIVSLDNVAGQETVKYRGYLFHIHKTKDTTNKKKRLHYIFKFSTRVCGVFPIVKLAANEVNCKKDIRE